MTPVEQLDLLTRDNSTALYISRTAVGVYSVKTVDKKNHKVINSAASGTLAGALSNACATAHIKGPPRKEETNAE